MSQYAYIPASANPVTPNGMINWNFTRNGIDYIGWESPLFTAEQITYIASLGGNYFTTTQLFLKWFELSNTVESIIAGQRSFCFSFQAELFKQLRNDQSLTNTQRINLISAVQLGMNALSWGDAEVARAAFNSIATTALWTQARKDWVLAQIDLYLNA